MNKRTLGIVVGSIALLAGGSVALSPTAQADAGGQPPADAPGVITYQRPDDVRPAEGVAALPGGAALVGDEDGAFHPVTPCRIYDSRLTTNPAGGPLLNAGEERSFNAVGTFSSQGGSATSCGIPSSATSVHMNITVAEQPVAAKGHVRIWPGGAPKPTASIVNFVGPDESVANAATIRMCKSASGGLCAADFRMFALTKTHIIIDVMGYYDQTLVAQVAATGTVSAGSGPLTSVSKLGVGEYQVSFSRNVTACVPKATIGNATLLTAGDGMIEVDDRAGNVNAVYVRTTSDTGAAQDRAFHLVMAC